MSDILAKDSLHSLYSQINDPQPKKSYDYEDYLSYEDTETADENENNFLPVSSSFPFSYNVSKWDNIDQVMLRAYEEEEHLVNEIEKVQNNELLSVLAEEAKLTKQLSFEKQFFFSGAHGQKFERSYLNETETEAEDQLVTGGARPGRNGYNDRESENDELQRCMFAECLCLKGSFKCTFFDVFTGGVRQKKLWQ